MKLFLSTPLPLNRTELEFSFTLNDLIAPVVPSVTNVTENVKASSGTPDEVVTSSEPTPLNTIS